MVSKLFVSVFVLMAVMSVSFSVAEEDDAAKVETKETDNPPIREEIKKFLSMMEKINLDQILNNNRLMLSNVKCFLDEGPCTVQVREMKKMLPKLVKDSCLSCTKEQKNLIKKSMDAIKSRRPNEFEQVTKFFDPEGKYEKKFLENLNKSE